MHIKALTSHTLFEWLEDGCYCSQFVNRLDPHYSFYERKPNVRRTAVSFKYYDETSLDGYWITTKGQRVFLPWRDL
jgi:predicted amidophosphoribosyltransferase